VPQMLSNIVCRITRTLTSLALEDQQYFSLLLAHLDHLLDSSRISIENLTQLVASANIDEATVSDTAAILCGKTLFKKYLIVPGSQSVYRDTSVNALVAVSSLNSSLPNSPARPVWKAAASKRGVPSTFREGLPSREGFDLNFQRVSDVANSDFNWICGQGDVLQHVLPCMMTLSGTLISDMGYEDDRESAQVGSNHTPDEDKHRYGKLLLTQLCASRGYCCRLLSSILVACVFIKTQTLVEQSEGLDKTRSMRENNLHLDDETDDSDETLKRLKEIDEFSRLCGTASMAAEQLNVLLEFSMGSDHGPQDQKLMESIKPELLKDMKEQGKTGDDLPDVFKPRHDPASLTTVCSMPPNVWTNLFRNLRLLIASLRSKVKPITFHNDKAANVATLLFSLDEMDSTVACLQPLLSL